jgi:hypothetical protein
MPVSGFLTVGLQHGIGPIKYPALQLQRRPLAVDDILVTNENTPLTIQNSLKLNDWTRMVMASTYHG